MKHLSPYRVLGIICIAHLMTLSGCKKKVDDVAFSGTVYEFCECTLSSMSISEQDWGYIVPLDTPEGMGRDYTDVDDTVRKNCIILYRTKAKYRSGQAIKGRLYFDDEYSRAYCNYHNVPDLPEAVCYSLE